MPVTGDAQRDLRVGARTYVDFCSEDVARAELLFQRRIPGFEPSAAAYAPAVEALDLGPRGWSPRERRVTRTSTCRPLCCPGWSASRSATILVASGGVVSSTRRWTCISGASLAAVMTVTASRLAEQGRSTPPRRRRVRADHRAAGRLPAPAWQRPTDCPEWDVRQLVSHIVGIGGLRVEPARDVRQARAARRTRRPCRTASTRCRSASGPSGLRPSSWPSCAPSRRARCTAAGSSPEPLRRVPMPVVGGRSLDWLMSVVLTRDAWMHRIDLARAADVPLKVTPTTTAGSSPTSSPTGRASTAGRTTGAHRAGRRSFAAGPTRSPASSTRSSSPGSWPAAHPPTASRTRRSYF